MSWHESESPPPVPPAGGLEFGATPDGMVTHRLNGVVVWTLDLEAAEAAAEKLDAAINAAYRQESRARKPAGYRSVNQYDED